MSAKIGLLKREAAELASSIARDAYTLDRECRRSLPSKVRIDRIVADIATNKERLATCRARIAELEAQEQ